MYLTHSFKNIRLANPFLVFFREIHISWQFIRSDFSCTILSASIFMLIALYSSPSTLIQDYGRLGWGFIYFWLYIYQFCLPTQIYGLAEDQLNKPNRPLPQGIISLQGAKARWAVATLLFYIISWILGVFLYALLWNLVTLYLIRGGDKHWFGKNAIAMGAGTFAQLAPAWLLITAVTPPVRTWIIIVPLWIAITASTQDFRDVAGDKQEGRRTLPIVFGIAKAKKVMSMIWILMAFLISFSFVILANTLSIPLLLGAILIFGIHLFIAYRLLSYNSPQHDHQTYMIYTYLYCLLLVSTIMFI